MDPKFVKKSAPLSPPQVRLWVGPEVETRSGYRSLFGWSRHTTYEHMGGARGGGGGNNNGSQNQRKMTGRCFSAPPLNATVAHRHVCERCGVRMRAPEGSGAATRGRPTGRMARHQRQMEYRGILYRDYFAGEMSVGSGIWLPTALWYLLWLVPSVQEPRRGPAPYNRSGPTDSARRPPSPTTPAPGHLQQLLHLGVRAELPEEQGERNLLPLGRRHLDPHVPHGLGRGGLLHQVLHLRDRQLQGGRGLHLGLAEDVWMRKGRVWGMNTVIGDLLDQRG